MTKPKPWLESIIDSNREFVNTIDKDNLPIDRVPGPAVITCMDPRVNLAAIGISGFAEDGSCDSSVRVIRTIGAMSEERSLIVGIFLANITEIVVLMHTDCGCCLAYSKIDTIVARMQEQLSAKDFEAYQKRYSKPFRQSLLEKLKAFQSPYDAVKKEVEAIKSLSYAPKSLIVHGLVYSLATAKVEVVVNGYA